LVSIEIVAGIEIFFVKEIQHVVLRRGDCLTFTHTKTTAIFYTIELTSKRISRAIFLDAISSTSTDIERPYTADDFRTLAFLRYGAIG
jgi:hypothetical protein